MCVYDLSNPAIVYHPKLCFLGSIVQLKEISPCTARVAMKRIAIVDDQIDSAEILGLILAERGYETYVFTDPQLLARSPLLDSFDLLILDIALPEIDGFELLRRVRVSRPTLPMVALSALSGTRIVAQLHKSGFRAFFQKPILDNDRFFRTIGTLIAQA